MEPFNIRKRDVLDRRLRAMYNPDHWLYRAIPRIVEAFGGDQYDGSTLNEATERLMLMAMNTRLAVAHIEVDCSQDVLLLIRTVLDIEVLDSYYVRLIERHFAAVSEGE